MTNTTEPTNPSLVGRAVAVLRTLGVPALVVAAGTMGANVLAYVYLVILTRTLDPAELGAVVALLNLVVIVGVPALALQLVTARQVSRALAVGSDHAQASALSTAVLLGGASTALTLLATPVLVQVLHLDSWWPPVLVAALLLPTCVTFGIQGALQGLERFSALVSVYLATTGLRVGAALLAVHFGLDVTGVLALTCAGSWLALAVAVALDWPALRQWRPRSSPSLLRAALHGSTATSALLVVTNVDTLLARAFLSGEQSGVYAVGSVFAKAAFWGPAFLVTLAYPRMARSTRSRAVPLATAVTAVIGLIAVLASWLLREPLVRLVGGPLYREAAPPVALFVGLGVAWSIVQVVVYWRLARADHRLAYATWLVAGTGVGVVVFARHSSVTDIASTLLVSGLVVAGYGVALLWAGRRR